MPHPGSSGATRPPPKPHSEPTAAELESEIHKRAREFSLPALLDVLHFLGYRSEDIEFRSHMSQARPSSLVQAVNFSEDTSFAGRGKKVHVLLNLGLLSAQSPLPSYFLKLAERLEGEALVDFLGFFDHHLLKRRAMSLYPERDRTVFADWQKARSDLVQLVGIGAPSTLHWLCQQVYPELGILVERSTAQKPLKAQGAVLGNAVLGAGCAFGGGTSVPIGGIDITLYCEETHSPTGIPWPMEAAARLHAQIFPLLHSCDFYLSVHLLILEQENWLQIQEERFLGYEPLWEPSLKRSAPPSPGALPTPPRTHEVLLYAGPTKQAAKLARKPDETQAPAPSAFAEKNPQNFDEYQAFSKT